MGLWHCEQGKVNRYGYSLKTQVFHGRLEVFWVGSNLHQSGMILTGRDGLTKQGIITKLAA